MLRAIRPLAFLILFALGAAACSRGSEEQVVEPSPTPGPTAVTNELPPTPTPVPIPENAIKVGVLLDTGGQSGDVLDSGNVMSSLDRSPGIGFEATIASINDAGGLLGRPIHLIKVDTTSRLSVIDAAAEDMIEAGVDLIVITCEFDFASPAIRRAEEAGVLVISPCASETGWTTGEAGELAFSMVPPSSSYGIAMADYMWGLGYRDVAVISDASAPEARGECNSFSTAWRELGGTFAYVEAFSLQGADEFNTNVEVRQAQDADAIAFCAFSIIGEKLLASGEEAGGLRSAGILAPIVAGPSFDTGTWLPLDLPNLGVFTLLALSSVHGDDPSARQGEAMQGFLALDNAAPASGRFVVGADLADLWAQAVVTAGTTDGAAVAGELRKMSNVESISGQVSFNGAQAPVSRELRILRHSNGLLVFDGIVVATQGASE